MWPGDDGYLEYDATAGLWYRPGTVDPDVIREAGGYFSFPVAADDRVLDLGAHIGAVAVHAARLGARVVAVEPEPENVGILRQNADLYPGLIAVVDAAVVSNGPPTLSLYVLETKGTYMHSIFAKRGRKEIEVPTVDFTDLLGQVRPTVLKADIEGAEYGLDWSAVPGSSVKALALGLHQIEAGHSDRAVQLREQIRSWGWTELRAPNVGNKAWDVTGIWVRPGAYDPAALRFHRPRPRVEVAS